MLNTEIGSPDAEAYCSVERADTYHEKRGAAAWAALTESQKEAALRLATDYLTQTYRMRWAGSRVDDVQALDWPRNFVPRVDGSEAFYPSDAIPKELIFASAELALRSVSGPLIEDTEPPVIEETIGPITTRYAPSASQRKKYPAIERMLVPLLSGAGEGVKFVRV